MKLRTITDDGKLKTSKLLDRLRKEFDVWCYLSDEELDEQFPRVKSERQFKDTQEADEDLKNLSANDLKKKCIEGITLRERLIFEWDYFKETGEHLDVKNITLCSGSRSSDGDVPSASWDPAYRRFYVDWYFPGNRSDDLRSRSAVSLESSDLETRVLKLEEKMKKISKVLVLE